MRASRGHPARAGHEASAASAAAMQQNNAQARPATHNARSVPGSTDQSTSVARSCWAAREQTAHDGHGRDRGDGGRADAGTPVPSPARRDSAAEGAGD